MLTADGIFASTPGARVLDLYAGSGALAFEALSRGASSATLVEQGKDAAAAIRTNARALQVENLMRLITTRVERALMTLEGPFGVVFVDPPYAEVRTEAFPDLLSRAAELLTSDGVLVLEHASADAPPTTHGLTIDRSRRHGDTTLTIYTVPT